MRIEYDATLDEVVDAQERTLKRSRAARSWTRSDFLLGSLLTGLATGAGLHLLLPSDEDARWVGVVLGAVIAAGGYILTYPLSRRSRIRRYCREQLGGEGPYPVVVELLPDGLRFEQAGVKGTVAWSRVEDILESNGDVEMMIRQAGVGVIPDRAFESDDQKQRFIDEVTWYRDAHGSQPAYPASSVERGRPDRR